MKYASTLVIDGVEQVVVVLPLEIVPGFDPENPPQENTFGVPDEVEVGWLRVNGVFVKPTKTHDQLVAEFVRAVDSDVDTIYGAVIGNRSMEYAQAESEAKAFTEAGYLGEAPGYVTAWANATGKTAEWAANNILSTAQSWRHAQALIRQTRLSCKEQARKTTTQGELLAVKSSWLAFVTAIKTQLGV